MCLFYDAKEIDNMHPCRRAISVFIISGFVSRQFDNAEECMSASLSLAREIAARSPIAVQGTKVTLNYSRDHPVDDSINFIRTWNQSQLQCEDLLRAGTAALNKQQCKFDDV